MTTPRARNIWLFVFGAMLSYDGGQFVLSLIRGNRTTALISGAGVILLVGIIVFLFTRAPRADGRRGR